MRTHSELRDLLDDPKRIASRRDLNELLEHLPGCSECLPTGRQVEELSAVRVRYSWPHLPRTALKALADSGFAPESNRFVTIDEWHIASCPRCKARYQRLVTRPQSHPLYNPIYAVPTVAAIVVLIFATMPFIRSWLTATHRYNEPSAQESLSPRPVTETAIPTVQSDFGSPKAGIAEASPGIATPLEGVVSRPRRMGRLKAVKRIYLDPQLWAINPALASSFLSHIQQKASIAVLADPKGADAELRIVKTAPNSYKVELFNDGTVIWSESIRATEASAAVAGEVIAQRLALDLEGWGLHGSINTPAREALSSPMTKPK